MLLGSLSKILKVLPPDESWKIPKIEISGIWVQIIGLFGSENPLKTNRLVLHLICSQFDCIWINFALVFARIWIDICSIFGFWPVIPDGWFFWADFRREGVETDYSKCEKWVYQTFLHRYRKKKSFSKKSLKFFGNMQKKYIFLQHTDSSGGRTLTRLRRSAKS